MTDLAMPPSPSPSLSPDAGPAQAPAPASPVVPASRPRSRSTLGTYLVAGALVVAVAGVAFAAGRLTAPTGNGRLGQFGAGGQFGASGQFGAGGQAGTGGQAGLFGGGLSVRGTVSGFDGQTLTLTLASGQTTTIQLSGSTTYHTATTASASAVTTGSTVVVEVQGFGRGGADNQGGEAPNPSRPPTSLQLSATDVTVVSP